MLIVFIILAILILGILYLGLLALSTLKIKVPSLCIDNIGKKKLEIDYLIQLEWYLGNKIKIGKIKIDKKRVQKMKLETKFKKINKFQKKSSLPKKDWKEAIKVVKPEIDSFHLELKIDTKEMVLTTFLVFFLSTAISLLLGKLIQNYDKKKYSYQILPLYLNQDLVKLNLDCIIRIKMVHIINMLYRLNKKGRVKKNERTSNRRSYAYRYE